MNCTYCGHQQEFHTHSVDTPEGSCLAKTDGMFCYCTSLSYDVEVPDPRDKKRRTNMVVDGAGLKHSVKRK